MERVESKRWSENSPVLCRSQRLWVAWPMYRTLAEDDYIWSHSRPFASIHECSYSRYDDHAISLAMLLKSPFFLKKFLPGDYTQVVRLLKLAFQRVDAWIRESVCAEIRITWIVIILLQLNFGLLCTEANCKPCSLYWIWECLFVGGRRNT